MTDKSAFLTISLERKGDGDHFFYCVSIVNEAEQVIKGSEIKKEDYNEALIYAKCAFENLRESYPDCIIASYVEQPWGGSINYALNEFATPNREVDANIFYGNLAEEFDEMTARVENPQANEIFRQIVGRYELDINQESQFLDFLKRSGIVSDQVKT